MQTQKKILIAEDSNIVLSVVTKILENMNYEVVGVKNGEELLKSVEDHPFDLILMDINMPKMDGITCTKHIRENKIKRIKEIPIIAISGNAMNYSVEEYKELGINDLIQKPIDFDLLAKKIFEMLS
jgi:hypothetical protein